MRDCLPLGLPRAQRLPQGHRAHRDQLAVKELAHRQDHQSLTVWSLAGIERSWKDQPLTRLVWLGRFA